MDPSNAQQSTKYLLGRPSFVAQRRHRQPWTIGQTWTNAFRAGLLSSELCRPDAWTTVDVDGLVRLYNTEITTLLDRLIPYRSVTYRRRPSDPWFDDDCRAAKRRTRLLERAARRAAPCDVAAATAEWVAQRRVYARLRCQKREAFWQSKIAAQSSNPRRLWQSVDALMGRGRVPTCDAIGAADLHKFFDAKVEGVRTMTADAPPPSFLSAPRGCSLRDFQLLSVSEIVTAVGKLPDKQSAADPLPTRLLKDNADILAPFLVER